MGYQRQLRRINYWLVRAILVLYIGSLLGLVLYSIMISHWNVLQGYEPSLWERWRTKPSSVHHSDGPYFVGIGQRVGTNSFCLVDTEPYLYPLQWVPDHEYWFEVAQFPDATIDAIVVVDTTGYLWRLQQVNEGPQTQGTMIKLDLHLIFTLDDQGTAHDWTPQPNINRSVSNCVEARF